jgi:hypothetical protein
MSSGWERSGEKTARHIRVDTANPHYFRRRHARDVTNHDAARRHRIIYPEHSGLVPPWALDPDQLSVLYQPQGRVVRAQAHFRTAVRITAPRRHEP